MIDPERSWHRLFLEKIRCVFENPLRRYGAMMRPPKVIDSDPFLSKWGHDLLDAAIVRQFEERIIKHWVSRLAIPAGVLRETETFQRNKTKIRNRQSLHYFFCCSQMTPQPDQRDSKARLSRDQLSVSRQPWVNFEPWSCKLLKLE